MPRRPANTAFSPIFGATANHSQKLLQFCLTQFVELRNKSDIHGRSPHANFSRNFYDASLLSQRSRTLLPVCGTPASAFLNLVCPL